tara:strand:+ start:2005 stop:3876 length:1872 start_codon:yes stop_codon:yes gene_type:complete
MAVNTALQVSDLDFDNIKSNLMQFVKSKNQFADFDFEGSNLSLMADMLAYNTFYNAYYVNQLANESFLQSAQLRNNVVSKAKGIGYTPRSAIAPMAVVNIQIIPDTPTSDPLILEEYTEFQTEVNGETYFYVTTEAVTVKPNRTGDYFANNVQLREGTPIRHSYVNDDTNPDQQFLVKNITADVTTLDVVIQSSQLDETASTWYLANNVTEIFGTSNVYYLDEVDGGRFEVTFGNGTLGRKIEDGNLVLLDYISTNGEASNKAFDFVPTGTVAGQSESIITTVQASSGGKPRESVAEIKYNAPKYFAAQGRCVTLEDYLAYTRVLVQNLDSLTGWGGEDNDPPRYGDVFIAVKPQNRAFYSYVEKQNIRMQLTERNLVAIRINVIDPDYTFIELTIDIYYKPDATPTPQEIIAQNVHNYIKNFSKGELLTFDRIFRYSSLIADIDKNDVSIRNNLTSVRLRKTFIPSIVSENNLDLKTNNTLYLPNQTYVGTLTSTKFSHENDAGSEVANCQFEDLHLGNTVQGRLRVIYVDPNTLEKTIVKSNVGKVHYDTGKIEIQGFRPLSFDNDKLDVFVRPAINDITPVRDQVLAILDEDIKITMHAVVDRDGNDPTRNTQTVSSSEN